MKLRRISEAEFSTMQTRVKAGVAPTAEHGTRNAKVTGSTPVASSKYRSKWEEVYSQKLELEKRAGLVCQYWYEPFSLWLPGKVRYKPDFLVEYFPADHTEHRPGFKTTLELIEVKGWSKNRRDGMTRLKIAAAIYSCFVWRLVWMKKGGHFDGEYV